jgi:hypothetical protein
MFSIAGSYGTSISSVKASLDTFDARLGKVFWSQGKGIRYVPCAGSANFLKMLGELIERHNKFPKVGTENDGSFMFARCLNPKSPFMQPATHLLIQLNRGMTPGEILSEEGWSLEVYKRLRTSLHRIGETPQRVRMNEKLELSDGLLLAAQVAEELLPYHMELYSEAQNLPKLFK